MTRHNDDGDGLFPIGDAIEASPIASAAHVAKNFDPARLTQARQLAGWSKKDLHDQIKIVTAAAIGQYESGTRPGPEVLQAMAQALGYPVGFFQIGRPYARLDASGAHFRHLRETRTFQRAKAVSFTEQVWELTYALERRVLLPAVDLPGFAGGEISPGTSLPADPIEAARALRQHWRLGTGPISHLVRTLEVHGIVVVHAPADRDFRTVDAFSTSRLPRPIVVITRDRSEDVYRHRFTAAHELGHLVLHGDVLPGDAAQEREANAFAAEFITPKASLASQLPPRVNFTVFAELQREWGVSIKSLIYRCREIGLYTDTTAQRAYQRLNQLHVSPEPIDGFAGEQPSLLAKAFELAEANGTSLSDIAEELRWPQSRLLQLLGVGEVRPKLDLLEGGGTTNRSDGGQRRRHLRAVPERS